MKRCVEHTDCGCREGAKCCLMCPLRHCVLDKPIRKADIYRPQIMRLRHEGKTAKQIAEVLGLAVKTVHNYSV